MCNLSKKYLKTDSKLNTEFLNNNLIPDKKSDMYGFSMHDRSLYDV
jgi:hypothetical protein